MAEKVSKSKTMEYRPNNWEDMVESFHCASSMTRDAKSCMGLVLLQAKVEGRECPEVFIQMPSGGACIRWRTEKCITIAFVDFTGNYMIQHIPLASSAYTACRAPIYN